MKLDTPDGECDKPHFIANPITPSLLATFQRYDERPGAMLDSILQARREFFITYAGCSSDGSCLDRLMRASEPFNCDQIALAMAQSQKLPK